MARRTTSKEERRRHWGNDFGHFAAMAILVAFAIPITLICFGFLSDSFGSRGDFIGLFTSMCEVIPFGNKFCEFAVLLSSTMTSFISDTSDLMNEISKYTPASYLFEFAKLIVATVFYEALFGAGKVVTDLNVREGFWNKGQEALLNVLCAFLGGIIASVSMGFLEGAMADLPTLVKAIISGVISIGSLIGLFMVLKIFVTTYVVGRFVAGFIVEHIIINGIKLAATYVFSLLMLIGIAYGNWAYVAASSGGIITIFIMMHAISLMLEPIFE